MEYLKGKLRKKQWRMFSALVPSMFILLVAFQNCKDQSVIVALSNNRDHTGNPEGDISSSTPTTTIQDINENITIPDLIYIQATSSDDLYEDPLDPTLYAYFPVGTSVDLELIAPTDDMQNVVHFRWGIKSAFLGDTYKDAIDQKTELPVHGYTFPELGVYDIWVTPIEQAGSIENQNLTDPLVIHDSYRVWDPIYKTIIIGQCENDNIEILSESPSSSTSSSEHYITLSIDPHLELLDDQGVLIETTPSDLLWQVIYDEEVIESSDQSITIDLSEPLVSENISVDLFIKPTKVHCIIHKTFSSLLQELQE